jgi:MFS family permease
MYRFHVVFGMSQFIFQTPAGYLFDYSDKKILWLSAAAIATTLLTIFTAIFATPEGGNLGLMIFVKFLQGAVTSAIPPGLNSITQGIVTASGMTQQVSVNEMLNHLGTAIIVLVGSLLGVSMYPNLAGLFVVSPIACAGVLYFLSRINPLDIDHNEARGLTKDTTGSKAPTTGANYAPPDQDTMDGLPASPVKGGIENAPSFNLDTIAGSTTTDTPPSHLKADSPLRVLRDPVLLTFILIVFLFHSANGTVLPLVMQTLALGSGPEGILLSGLCIIVAQIFMVMSAKVCGTYSGKYGRKDIFLVGLASVPVRCLILTLLLQLRGDVHNGGGSLYLNILILSTQILDGVGAGVFGTMYILVTSDISMGTGRFSMTLGLTTAAMSIGGTVSGYVGQALAQDRGYQEAFMILTVMSMIPAVVYYFFMPETLSSLAKANDPRMASVKEDAEENYRELS